jgi:hypothetical protein
MCVCAVCCFQTDPLPDRHHISVALLSTLWGCEFDPLTNRPENRPQHQKQNQHPEDNEDNHHQEYSSSFYARVGRRRGSPRVVATATAPPARAPDSMIERDFHRRFAVRTLWLTTRHRHTNR